MNDFDTTDIEETLKVLLRDEWKISERVYSDRPKSVDEKTNDFIVAKVIGSVVDMDAFGACTVAIYLFAKDVSNQKNGKKLSVMYKKFIASLTGSDGRYNFDKKPTVVGDVSDDYGFHARLIQMKLLIKAN